MVLGCNALAISGAFLVGLTSLHVVVLTNIGALAAGALYGRHMRHSDRLLAARRTQGLPTGHEILLPAPEDEPDLVAPIPAPAECCIVETNHPAGKLEDTLEMDRLRPSTSMRRAAARREARLKQLAAKQLVHPDDDVNDNHSP